MTIRSIWNQRAQARYKEIADRERAKRPHWSRIIGKRADDLNPMAPLIVKHMARPGIEMSQTSTLCGWSVASMRAANAYGLPRPLVIPAANTMMDTLAQAFSVTCPECHETLDDFASWIGIGVREDDSLHMQWPPAMSIPAMSIACDTIGRITRNQSEHWRQFHSIDTPHKHCAICLAIYQRLYGGDRLELRWNRYETAEEAVKEH